jgi:hypothetical protein
MKRPGLRSALALMLTAALAAGCNVFEGMYEAGASDDPQELFEDGRIALQKNDAEAAVGHLRKALAQETRPTPLRKRIQIKLATALLQTREINVMTLTRITEKLSGRVAPAAGAGKDGQGEVCNFNPVNPHEAFDPRQGVDFERLGAEASQAAMEEANALISAVFAGEAGGPPGTPYTFPCDGIDDAVAGLQAQGVTDTEIAEGIANYAVSVMTRLYVDIVAVGGNQATFFYVTPQHASGDNTDFVGFCFADLASCESTVAWIQANVGSMECVTRLLEKRAALLGNGTTAQELALTARDAYDRMIDGLQNAACQQLQ